MHRPPGSAFGRRQVPSLQDDLISLLVRHAQDPLRLVPCAAQGLVGFPSSEHDRLVGRLLREREHARGQFHVVNLCPLVDLCLERCSSTACTGVDPEPEGGLGQLPSGKGIEFSLPLFLVPIAELSRKASGCSPDQPGAHPGEPVYEFADQHRNEDDGEYEDDGGHRPTPHPGWRTGPKPSRRSRSLSRG